MQDQPNPAGAGVDSEQVERVVLTLLLDRRNHGPWTAEEIGLELGDEIAAVDAVASLHGSGLVHLCR